MASQFDDDEIQEIVEANPELEGLTPAQQRAAIEKDLADAEKRIQQARKKGRR